MELRVIGRGALSGALAGILSFLFAKIFAEPVIDKAIDYESGRDAALDALNRAANRPLAADGPEIFSRHVQSTVGIATGLIGMSIAFGLLVSVAYVVLHGRFQVRVRTLALLIPLFGFLGVSALPFVKYPSNPPAIGHTFTIVQRGHLYVVLVVSSLVLLGLATYVGVKLRPRVGVYGATLVAGAGFLVVFCLVIGLLPSLGNLHANVDATHQFGYARSATETPQPITNILSTPITITLDGTTRTYQPGQIVYPGFSADVLWKFRWYSLLNLALIWGVIGLSFSFLTERFFRPRQQPAAPSAASDRPVPASV